MPKFFVNEQTIATILDLFINKFDVSVLPKILSFLRHSPKLSLSHLSAYGSPKSTWLRLMLSDKYEDLQLSTMMVPPDHLGFPLKALRGQFTLEDIETIVNDPFSPMFCESMKIALKYLENCDQAPIELLYLISKTTLEGELLDILCHIVVKFQCMKTISVRFQEHAQSYVDFQEIETWCNVLLKLNPSEAVEFFLEFLDCSDSFWIQISEWLTKNESIFHFLRPELVQRINILDALPSPFIIAYLFSFDCCLQFLGFRCSI